MTLNERVVLFIKHINSNISKFENRKIASLIKLGVANSVKTIKTLKRAIKREEYIFLDPKLKDIFIQNGFEKYKAADYIFTFSGKPGPVKSAEDFLQKRFRKVRAALDLSQDYTLYSFKHTRAVNLLQDGAQPVDIMQLFRHTDLTTTTKYIRDLGFDLNTGFSKLSRNI